MPQSEKEKGHAAVATTNGPIKQIKVGKFYLIHDGSKTGHPGYVFWKDDERNRYLVIKTDSDKVGDVPKKDRGVKHLTPLAYPTDRFVLRSYIHNRPLLCKRKDIGILLPDMRFHPSDYRLVAEVEKRPPERAPSLK